MSVKENMLKAFIQNNLHKDISNHSWDCLRGLTLCNSPFIVKHGTTPMGINEVLLQPLILLFLKTLSSCSFDMLQSKHRGATCHTFLFLLSNSLYFHLRRSFHIKARSTYFRPKTTNRNIHSFFVLSQYIKIWSTDSSLSL